MEVSESNLEFHDILIYNDGNQIWMDMHSKPTYSKDYIVLLIPTILKAAEHTLWLGEKNMYK